MFRAVPIYRARYFGGARPQLQPLVNGPSKDAEKSLPHELSAIGVERPIHTRLVMVGCTSSAIVDSSGSFWQERSKLSPLTRGDFSTARLPPVRVTDSLSPPIQTVGTRHFHLGAMGW